MKIIRELGELSEVRAPQGFVGRVMARIGGDRYARVEGDVWPLWIAFNADGVCAVMRADENDEATFTRWFRDRFDRPLHAAERPPAALTRSRRFDLRQITPFEREVLLKTAEIPRGEVRTYGWVAREIGRPAAVRAVGSALANNPIPVLIPCHRVVRSDGMIGQYGAGGTSAKKEILSREGVEPEFIESLARARIRFHGSRTTHIFCLPTCRHARRVLERHRVEFHSEREARENGYRPCRICRPAAAA